MRRGRINWRERGIMIGKDGGRETIINRRTRYDQTEI